MLNTLLTTKTLDIIKHCQPTYLCFVAKRKRRKAWFKIAISLLWNKYFISILAVLIWLGFFDKNDYFSQRELRMKLNQLRTEEDYYRLEIEKNKKDMNELRHNPATLEKFAREKYLMKRDGEEIFVIVKDSTL